MTKPTTMTRAQRSAARQAVKAAGNAIAFRKPTAPEGKTTKPPVPYSPEVAEAICRGVAEGKSLLAVCQGPSMPDRGNVYVWLERHPEFAAQYKRALEKQAISVVDEMATIEQDLLAGTISPDVGRVVLGSKQWRAKTLNRVLFGDQVGVTGPGGGPLQQVTRIELVAVAPAPAQTIIDVGGES